MSSMQRHDEDAPGSASPFGRLDRLFDEWMRSMPMRRVTGGWESQGEDMISVDEYRDGQTQVIRAEIPGIDPDKDVELTVDDGMLRIDAERRVEKDTEDKGYTRHELRYGRFTRTLPLPDGATDADIAATYKDGVLEIRVPVPERPAPKEPTKIAISTG